MATKEDKPTNNDTDNEPKKPEDADENASQTEENAAANENPGEQGENDNTAETSADSEPSEADGAEKPADGETGDEKDKNVPTQDTGEPNDNIDEKKVDNERKVFYVDGYGNVNGCKTQAEAERKAKKLIEKARR